MWRHVVCRVNDAISIFLAEVPALDVNAGREYENEFAERIGAFAEKLPAGRWITGGDWDHERWPEMNGKAPLPTKELIDRLTPNTPVFVSRLDGHMALANSLTLKLAGITRDTPNPEGGLIVRDPGTGEATGVLKDAAMSFVWKIVPNSSFDEKLAAARAATEHAASLGVTSVQDMSAGSDVGVYQLSAPAIEDQILCRFALPAWTFSACGVALGLAARCCALAA